MKTSYCFVSRVALAALLLCANCYCLAQTTVPATGLPPVNTTSRVSVRHLYNLVYAASENIPSDWTGNVTDCDPGETGQAFRDATLLRINLFRAMAGVPARVTENSDLSWYCQRGALMLSANNRIEHFVDPSWKCYTPEAAGSLYGSITLGANGPQAMTGYVGDHGSNNQEAGHRIHLLYPPTQSVGLGDTERRPGVNSAANVHFWWDEHSGDPWETRDGFVAWPPPGHVPYQWVYPRWSLSLDGGWGNEFLTNQLTLTVRKEGKIVPVKIEYAFNYQLVWTVEDSDPNREGSHLERVSHDTEYQVTVSGVVRDFWTTNTLTYTVTVIDPDVSGTGEVTQSVTAPAYGSVGTPVTVSATADADATGYDWDIQPVVQLQGLPGKASVTPYQTLSFNPEAAGTYAVRVRPQYFGAFTGEWSKTAYITVAAKDTVRLFISREGNALALRLIAPAGSYTIQTAGDLVHWQDWKTISSDGQTVSLADTVATGTKFYRVK